MSKNSFQITKKDSTTNARVGLLSTRHGTVETPAYVMVATHGSIRCLEPADIPATKTQIVISNTYHLWQKALAAKQPGRLLYKLLKAPITTMTDSGGFQVFSFGAGREHNVGKVLKRGFKNPTGEKSAVRITEKGVYFSAPDTATNKAGKKQFLGPELSMQIQKAIGGDIIFAFDECTSPLHSTVHTAQAMARTHRWAIRCLKEFKKLKQGEKQMLFGIVQGGRSQRLRAQSAKHIGALPFSGFGIGGSFGEDEMARTLKTVTKYLPNEKPRHLLGIGRIEDIFIAVENGIDSFDCVIPTREARHARIWTSLGPYDIRQGKFKFSAKRLAPGCKCPACLESVTQGQLRDLFKTKNEKAGRYATLHNVWFFNDLMDQIRSAIRHNRFSKFKQAFLARLSRSQVRK